MAAKHLDYKGLKCPLPTLTLNRAYLKKEITDGDLVEVVADCPSFEADIKTFCAKHKKVLVKCYADGANKVAKVQF